ncbi:uncharacterized protein LOC122818865 [Drosophila biarmipes]|uniref:uncharacterized protein LOC122818865 n=1 Tax=Drosophila biarmipes TaxID=125945 RepID=UPI001CDA9C52|nr:uncharacterized protein LOC122818865 [Drosophila biarmipes]
MDPLIIFVILIPLIEAQDDEPGNSFNLTTDVMGSVITPDIVKIENQVSENEEVLDATEQSLTTTVFPPIRCLSCAYCGPSEGKSRNSKGKKMCPIRLGEVQGCLTVFFISPNTAGGPVGFLVRSCISDQDEDGREYCKKNKKLCEVCFDDDCNYVDITKDGLETGGGSRIMAPLLVIISLTGCLSW